MASINVKVYLDMKIRLIVDDIDILDMWEQYRNNQTPVQVQLMGAEIADLINTNIFINGETLNVPKLWGLAKKFKSNDDLTKFADLLDELTDEVIPEPPDDENSIWCEQA